VENPPKKARNITPDKKRKCKKNYFTVSVFMIKGIGKRLQNGKTEPKPLVSGYPKVYAIHREAKFI